MIGINNCDKCCNMQQVENVDQSKDNLDSQVTICLFLQAMFHHDTPNVSWWVKFTPYVWCSLRVLNLGICVSVCCLWYFLIFTLYNFWLIPPTYCGSDISGTNQYLAPLSSLAGMCAAAGLQWASCQLLQDQLLLPRSQRQESSSRLGADVLVH